MIDTRKTILGVLDIIGYEKDKEAFADEMLAMSEKHALTELIKSLPDHKRTPLVHLLNITHRKQELITILRRDITAEAYALQLEKSINDLFFDYLETIEKTLDEEKKKKLNEYLASLVKAS